MTAAPEGEGKPGDPEVAPAGPERVPELAALLGRAFADDPMIVWPLRPGAGEAGVRRMFEILDLPLAHMGALFEAGPSLGVAAWVAPEQIDAYIEIDAQTRPLVAALTDDGGARYAALWDWVESRIPDEPLWFLDQVAVDATARGRGLGAALITFGLSRARAEGLPAFLETARPENVGYYQRLGFRVVANGDVPGGGPHIWFLRADPDATADSRGG